MYDNPCANAAELYPRSGKWEPSIALILDVARSLARRVALTKLVELDATVRPNLEALLAATIVKFNGQLVVP